MQNLYHEGVKALQGHKLMKDGLMLAVWDTSMDLKILYHYASDQPKWYIVPETLGIQGAQSEQIQAALIRRVRAKIWVTRHSVTEWLHVVFTLSMKKCLSDN